MATAIDFDVRFALVLVGGNDPSSRWTVPADVADRSVQLVAR